MDLRRLLKLEDDFLSQTQFPDMGWEAHDLGLRPQEVKNLLNDGLIRIVYKSNNHTDYRVVRDEVEHQIQMQNEINVLFAPTDSTEPNDLFASIYGYDDIKQRIISFIRRRQRGGFLFIGPPASAKSLFLMEISRLPGAMYITASNTTKASVRDILIDDEPSFLCIDELDKASARDYDTLLSLMETGIVQKNTHYGRSQKVLTTQVFAAANNDTMPPEIKSRFVVLHIPEYTPDQMRDVGMYMLTKREGLSETAARYIVGYALSELHVHDVRDFLKIARIRMGDSLEDIQDSVDFLRRYSPKK